MPENETQPFTRENLNECLKDLAKEFRKLNGTKTPAEIILIGGAAVLANYGFREKTYDIDAIIVASSAMKDAINRVSDKHGLPYGWLNADFKRTASYSNKLFEVSVYYRQFSNILTVRTITAEYLLAMKLMSGRPYKNDLSDIVGILWEHQKRGKPILRETVERAIMLLYGQGTTIPEMSMQLLDAIFAVDVDEYEVLYHYTRENEIESRELLLEFAQDHPNTLKGENINSIIYAERRKRDNERKFSFLEYLEKMNQSTKPADERKE